MGASDRRSSASLEAVYATRFLQNSPERLEWRRGVWQVLVESFFSKWIPKSCAVLDFGSGLGEFINAVKARRRIAVDLRPGVGRYLQPDVEFIHYETGWAQKLGPGSVDVIFCSNLLEHLPDRSSVTNLLQEFRFLLQPAGRLLILGPNIRYAGPKYWDFFDHILPLTHLSLVEALGTGGFEPEILIPRFLPFTTVGARRTPLFLVRWYLRLPFVWRLMGAQFFAVARPVASSRDSEGDD